MSTPFVLAACNRETMIVNRLCFGVGAELLNSGHYNLPEIEVLSKMLQQRRETRGDGVVVFDCGANIGTHTIAWAKLMRGWGGVIAIEAQERIFYALAGNIAINNCLNARAIWSAVGKERGSINVPQMDFRRPGHFSGLELRKRPGSDTMGQEIDYGRPTTIGLLSLDSLGADRADLIKIDVEGMDLEVLEGAEDLILKYRPVIFVEVFKNDKAAIGNWLTDRGYIIAERDINFLATHKDDISYDV